VFAVAAREDRPRVTKIRPGQGPGRFAVLKRGTTGRAPAKLDEFRGFAHHGASAVAVPAAMQRTPMQKGREFIKALLDLQKSAEPIAQYVLFRVGTDIDIVSAEESGMMRNRGKRGIAEAQASRQSARASSGKNSSELG